MTDITLLTDSRYVNPAKPGWYEQNILLEDELLGNGLRSLGLKVCRTNWDNPNYDWSDTRYAMFRTTWDYFDRYAEFKNWLEQTSAKCRFINPIETVRWNMDKHYLAVLENSGIAIPPTLFIEKGDVRTLTEISVSLPWQKLVVKPCVGGTARHLHVFNRANAHQLEPLYSELISRESMMIQEYQHSITEKGEVAFMVFGGKFSHAVLKKARPGDFRVQDDFGGTLHDYDPSQSEIEFAEYVVGNCGWPNVYARVDVMWNNAGELCVSELELIEPELWFRRKPVAANKLSKEIFSRFFN